MSFRICSHLMNESPVLGFMQKKFSNGTFKSVDPKDCSPLDKDDSRACSLTDDNENGFFESSSWEVRSQLAQGPLCLWLILYFVIGCPQYSFFAPHDTAHLIELMGGNVSGLWRR